MASFVSNQAFTESVKVCAKSRLANHAVGIPIHIEVKRPMIQSIGELTMVGGISARRFHGAAISACVAETRRLVSSPNVASRISRFSPSYLSAKDKANVW